VLPSVLHFVPLSFYSSDFWFFFFLIGGVAPSCCVASLSCSDWSLLFCIIKLALLCVLGFGFLCSLLLCVFLWYISSSFMCPGHLYQTLLVPTFSSSPLSPGFFYLPSALSFLLLFICSPSLLLFSIHFRALFKVVLSGCILSFFCCTLAVVDVVLSCLLFLFFFPLHVFLRLLCSVLSSCFADLFIFFRSPLSAHDRLPLAGKGESQLREGVGS